MCFFFFKHKTAYEMRISDWSSDVCSSDLVEQHVADATAKGAVVLAGGHRHKLGGSFFEPTVLSGVTQDMLIAREETFGPVAGVIRFETEAAAIALANDSAFGLAASFYARDLGRVWRVAEALETGIVGINTGLISTEEIERGSCRERVSPKG